jgi:subtilisin family serine protease
VAKRHFFFRIYTLFTVTAMMVAAAALPISAQEPQPPSGGEEAPQAEYVPGEILVKFKPGQASLNQQSALRAQGLRTLEISPHSGVMRVQVEAGGEAEAIDALQTRGDVEYAILNYRIQALGDPNDPNYGLQWALKQAQDHDIDAPEAWDINTGSSDVIIAVIDTGVDLDHPDLQAKLVPGYDYVNDDPIPDDDHGHGTHVAGIAAAVSNNGVGIAGVSWGARIMPLKVLDSGGNGNIDDLEDAIYYAVDNGAKVINMSLGAQYSKWPCTWPNIETAFNYAVSNDVLLAVAAGNDGQNGVNCPAAYDQAMAVGSTTSSDTLSWFSNYGPRLDIAAPGSGIYSTLPVSQGSYGYKNGTSMATPHVAGLAALIWSASPSLSEDQVRNFIQSTADDLGTAGWDQYFGHGRINAWQALDSSVSLQTSPGQTGFLIDDDSGPFPSSADVEVTTTSSEAITWTTDISPPVSWLEIVPPDSGTVSAASSDSFTLIVPDRPGTYGTFTTTVMVTGTTQSGETIGVASTDVRISYRPDLEELRLPLISMNSVP